MAEKTVTDKTARSATKKADGEAAVREKIAAMAQPYREIAERLHTLILENAPTFKPRLFYGMPAYAKDGKVVCFFRDPWPNEKHEYMTFGLTENANFTREDDSHQLLASAWYFTSMDDGTEAKLASIVRMAAG